jgi:hypothetical protein
MINLPIKIGFTAETHLSAGRQGERKDSFFSALRIFPLCALCAFAVKIQF